MSDNYRLSFHLFRAALGKFEFQGPSRLYFDPRFGHVEHRLLEVHEHNHWQLAHSTIFGLQQLSLAYALLLAKNDAQRRRYHWVLQLTSDQSREVYEGCAVFNEETVVEQAGAEVHPAWFEALKDTIYEESLELFRGFLAKQPYGAAFKASIANNTAELALNSAPRFLWRPAHLDPDEVAARISQASPNALLKALSECFSEQSGALTAALDEKVIRSAVDASGDALAHLLLEDAPQGIDATTSGKMSYHTYIALRDLALAHGVPIYAGSPHTVDLARYDIWLTWVRGLSGHERFYPNLVKNVAVSPEALNDRGDLRERSDYQTFQTSFDPPPRPKAEDIKLTDWLPLERALAHSPHPEQCLYVSISDDREGPLLKDVITPVPLVGFVADAESHPFGSSLVATMSVEAGKRRFDEETAAKDISHVTVRVGRAILAPGDGFAWRHIGARYRLAAKPNDLEALLEQLEPHRKAVAARWRNFDTASLTVFGIRICDLKCTLGVLVEESSVYGWARAIRQVSSGGRSVALHGILVGEVPEYRFNVGVIGSGTAFPIFLYSLASTYSFGRLMSMVRAEKAFGDGVRWVDSLVETGLTSARLAEIVSVCEHLIRRGF